MSSKAYIEASNRMTPAQHDAIWELWMKGVNHDGHAWVRFCDVEDCVAKLITADEDDRR